MALTRERNRERSEDTRYKVQMGGLVIKAELGDFSSSELLGAPVEINEMLKPKDGEVISRRFKRTGKAIFEADERKRERVKNLIKKTGELGRKFSLRCLWGSP